MPPHVLARLRNVPSRLFAALFTLGGMLGVPVVLGILAGIFGALDLPVVAAAAGILAFLAFFGFVVLAWVLIFQARSRLKRAEAALYQGDFDAATRDAHFVVRTVFRSDYQMGALFTLALAAERLGAFPEAGTLFTRALGMIPAMAAARPGRRARALLSAHAALDFAACNDAMRAGAMLERCQRELGAVGQPGALEALLDDSYMGALGINTMLVELENRRDPRPLAVLAWLLATFRSGQLQQVLAAVTNERQTIIHGLAPHEQSLAQKLESEAMRLMSGGPHRAPAALSQGSWADQIV